ncbi:hypothetical protein PFISCL1PPCAC_414, partial [Pristionchus fissidentatus]
ALTFPGRTTLTTSRALMRTSTSSDQQIHEQFKSRIVEYNVHTTLALSTILTAIGEIVVDCLLHVVSQKFVLVVHLWRPPTSSSQHLRCRDRSST